MVNFSKIANRTHSRSYQKLYIHKIRPKKIDYYISVRARISKKIAHLTFLSSKCRVYTFYLSASTKIYFSLFYYTIKPQGTWDGMYAVRVVVISTLFLYLNISSYMTQMVNSKWRIHTWTLLVCMRYVFDVRFNYVHLIEVMWRVELLCWCISEV